MKHYVDRTIHSCSDVLPEMKAFLAAASDPYNDPHLIVRLAEDIPGLAAQIHHASQTGWVPTPGRHLRCEEAVVTLGNPRVLALASHSLLRLLLTSGPPASTLGQIQPLLQRPAAALHLTEMLADRHQIPRDQRPDLYQASVLADSGEMLLATHFVSPWETLLRTGAGREVTSSDERQLLGTDHAETSSQLALAWELSQSTADLIAAHEGEFSERPTKKELILHVALRLSQQLVPAQIVPHRGAPLGYAAHELGLTQRGLDELLIRSQADLQPVLSAFVGQPGIWSRDESLRRPA